MTGNILCSGCGVPGAGNVEVRVYDDEDGEDTEYFFHNLTCLKLWLTVPLRVGDDTDGAEQ